jgi:hypothetical protein
MAVKFLTGIDLYGAVDLNQFELQNAVIQNLAAAPTTPAPVAGQIYYDTVLDKLRIYTGAAWLTMPDGTGANDFLTGLAFNTGNGILTATVSNQANVTVDLDGRYALSSAIPSVGDGTLTVQGTGVLGGSGTFTANQAGNTTISVTHDNVTRTDPSASTLSSNVFTFVDSITTSAQGHVTAVDTKTVTVPDNNDNTTYELFGVGSTNGTAGVQLDGSDGTLDNVLIVGAGTSSVTRSGNTLTVTSNDQYDGTVTSVIAGSGMTQTGTSTVNPTLNVIGGDGITANANDIEVDSTVIRTTGAQTLGDTKTFTSNVIIPVTPTLAANAASKSYVDSTLAGSGALIFQGGYNAATNTPDLDVSPSASIKQGWTYAVTTAGNFFAEAVEDGDLLIAESDAPTSLADWTVVQNNIGVATAGSTDGGTTKGIAGFNSAHFNVTSNGWVSSDIYGGGSSLGIVPSGGAAGTLLNGAGGWTAAYSLPEATATVRGGIELFSNTDQSVAANSVSSTAGRTYGSQLNSAGQLVVNVPWTDNNTTYSMMTATTLGLGKLEDNTTQLVAANLVSSTASRTYGIQKNSSNQLVVNVPWTDSTPVDTVTASTAADLDGLKVTPTVGNVVVGLDIDSLTTLSTANPAEHLIIMDETGANKKITIEDVALAGNQSTSYSKLGPPTASTSFTITNGNHGLGTNSEIIMVQLVEVATGETVHADVVRGASGLITITFGAAQSINAYRALLVKVG